MLASGDSNDHIWSQHRIVHSFDALWRYTKYPAHRLLVIKTFANIQVFIGITKKMTTYLIRYKEPYTLLVVNHLCSDFCRELLGSLLDDVSPETDILKLGYGYVVLVFLVEHMGL